MSDLKSLSSACRSSGSSATCSFPDRVALRDGSIEMRTAAALLSPLDDKAKQRALLARAQTDDLLAGHVRALTFPALGTV